MFFKRDGFPEEGELVICTVKKILYHSVFATIDEYRDREGMLHISEVAPGRIRNIRDYVREGKQIVCKVLRISLERGHIDLSLRRVNPSARSKKLEEFKQEERAEKILEQVGVKLKTNLADVYEKAGKKIVAEYGLLSPCFYDIVLNGDKALEGLEIPKEYVDALVEIVKEKISIPKVVISGHLILSNSSSEGVVAIKEALIKALDFAKKNDIAAELTYVGAPRYKLEITDVDYKVAEEKRTKLVEFIIKEMEASKGEAEFVSK